MQLISDNVEMLLLIAIYALERVQEFRKREKTALDTPVVETDESKVKGKGARVASFLFDLLPIVSRFKRKE